MILTHTMKKNRFLYVRGIAMILISHAFIHFHVVQLRFNGIFNKR